MHRLTYLVTVYIFYKSYLQQASHTKLPRISYSNLNDLFARHTGM